MMSFLNNFAKDFLSSEGGGSSSGGMEKMMSEFSSYMKDSDGNPDMKNALDSVVNELLNKETLYEPMRTLKEEYPAWLESNWEKIS